MVVHLRYMDFMTLMPIVAAGISSVVLAFIWYHKSIFGVPFMQMCNLSPEQAERGMRMMPLMTFLALISAMWAAYVMTFVLEAFQVYDVIGALDVGFWLWAGFAAVPMLGMWLWEGKPFKMFMIIAGYWLIAFMLMAVILVAGNASNATTQTQNDQIQYATE